jgi:hypothetical protein
MSRSTQSSTKGSNTSNLRNRRNNSNTNASRQNSRTTAEWDALDEIPQQDQGYLEDIRPRRQRTRQDDYLYYSLAGPPAPPPRFDQHQAYFDPGYLGLNPWMKQEDEGPNFTLANNFPRTVRWGGDDEGVKADEKGEQEPAPQMESAEEQGSEVEDGGGDEDRGMLTCHPSLDSSCSHLLTKLQTPSKTPQPWKKPSSENTSEDFADRTIQDSAGSVLMRRLVRGKNLVPRNRRKTLTSRLMCGLR